MCEIVPLLLFYKNGFGIKQPAKVDMPLNKDNSMTRDRKIFVTNKTW